MIKSKKWFHVFFLFVCFFLCSLLILFSGCKGPEKDSRNNNTIAEQPEIQNLLNETNEQPIVVEKGNTYYIKEEVAAYLNQYKELPPNYITKGEAQKLGWDSSKGNLWDIPGEKVIGGDRFGNREGLLPDAPGRIYFECDVNYFGGFRGSYRIVFSNDGLIYYTGDHYETFERLY